MGQRERCVFLCVGVGVGVSICVGVIVHAIKVIRFLISLSLTGLLLCSYALSHAYPSWWCMIFLPQSDGKIRRLMWALRHFFDNHFIISLNTSRITAFLHCEFMSCSRGRQSGWQISLSAQFINYNFRIIYQIAEYRKSCSIVYIISCTEHHMYSFHVFTRFAQSE